MLATFANRGRQIQIGRAPKGGLEFGGRFYRGGQFCPVAALPIGGGAPEVETPARPTGYRVYSGDRLSNSGFRRCGGPGSGSARWWVRGERGFADIPSVRGDERFDEMMDLEAGDYMLGTGRGKDAIREPFRVTEAGELVWL